MTPEAQRLAEECKRLVVALHAVTGLFESTRPGMTERVRTECTRASADLLAAVDQLASMIPAGGLAEEARDAARYRHLTDVHGPRSELCFDGDVCAGKAEFDAMIDASIAALSAPTPQQEQPR